MVRSNRVALKHLARACPRPGVLKVLFLLSQISIDDLVLWVLFATFRRQETVALHPLSPRVDIDNQFVVWKKVCTYAHTYMHHVYMLIYLHFFFFLLLPLFFSLGGETPT